MNILFQYRCSDILQYIGGYRNTNVYGGTQPTNVSYTRKIGIDIYQKDVTKLSGNAYGAVFSFDIQVQCKYDDILQGFTGTTSSTGTYNTVTY